MSNSVTEGGLLPCAAVPSRRWSAWNNLKPPLPNAFTIAGEVRVPNPGVEILLAPAEPQGINPEILLLDLYLLQRPGQWPVVAVWQAVEYRRVIGATGYTHADILCEGSALASVDVQNAH